jgi:hypothetical protein
MTEMVQIADLAKQLISDGADSVFLYGSQARGDNLAKSDWEIGVIFERSRKVSRLDLSELAPQKTVIYPFIRDELEAGIVMVPFTQSIWLTELIMTGKTLAGEKIIEHLELPKITREDLIAAVSFSKAQALDAMLAIRGGFVELGNDLLVKSCLFGIRSLILLETKKFSLSYEEIAKEGAELLPEEYKVLLETIVEVRHGDTEPSIVMAFDNLGLFSDVIEPLLQEGKI